MIKNNDNILLFESLALRDVREAVGGKVIVVDDCKDSLELISNWLTKYHKARVEVYTNPFDALRSIIKEEPDFLILDVEMPRLDGLELKRLVRAMSLFEIPTLFVSVNPKHRKRLTKKSFEYFEHKPLSKSRVLKYFEGKDAIAS
tara:strand:+ start:265646 stop:266080 length:435 start_codon:yes stop_codon:yes gene_type:complete